MLAKLARPRGSETVANFLRKTLALAPVAVNLLRETHGKDLSPDVPTLARHIKGAPITLTGTAAIDRAISTAGGVALDAVDENLDAEGDAERLRGRRDARLGGAHGRVSAAGDVRIRSGGGVGSVVRG